MAIKALFKFNHLPHLFLCMHLCTYVSLMYHPVIPQHLLSKIKNILQHNHNDIFTLKECNIGTLQLSNIESIF